MAIHISCTRHHIRDGEYALPAENALFFVVYESSGWKKVSMLCCTVFLLPGMVKHGKAAAPKKAQAYSMSPTFLL